MLGALRRTASKYATIFGICIVDRLTYRTDFFFGTLMRFLPIVTTIFLWSAIFDGAKQSVVAGFTREEIVVYYLMAMVGRAFSSMPGLAASIASDVRTGNIKKYLVQPVDLVGFLLVSRIAHKLIYYGVAAAPFALVFWLCRHYFSGWPTLFTLGCFIASLPIAFVIGFCLEALIGLLAFWVLEVGSFNFIAITFIYVASGHMFPLDLAGPASGFLKALPFQYMAYFPAMVFLRGDGLDRMALLGQVLYGAAVAGAMLLTVAFVYRRGLRRYSAFGG